jgi:hypothetical protein
MILVIACPAKVKIPAILATATATSMSKVVTAGGTHKAVCDWNGFKRHKVGERVAKHTHKQAERLLKMNRKPITMQCAISREI